jgi:hypothetical protein
MRRFLYWRDPLFLIGCTAYALNRWLLKPHLASRFLHGYFNDLWLIPCALPPLLWLHRRLGLRANDDFPRLSEIALHFAFWSFLFEYLGPKFMPHTVGDPLDVLAYAAGAIVAAIWWRSRDAAARALTA